MACVATEKTVAASSVIVGSGRSMLDERPRCDVRHMWNGFVNDSCEGVVTSVYSRISWKFVFVNQM